MILIFVVVGIKWGISASVKLVLIGPILKKNGEDAYGMSFLYFNPFGFFLLPYVLREKENLGLGIWQCLEGACSSDHGCLLNN